MPHTVKWLPEAISDLSRLREFISVHNPDAARRAAGRIREAVKKLSKFPFVGIPVLEMEEQQFRDLFVAFGHAGYWLRYTVAEDAIIIIRIWHGREERSH